MILHVCRLPPLYVGPVVANHHFKLEDKGCWRQSKFRPTNVILKSNNCEKYEERIEGRSLLEYLLWSKFCVLHHIMGSYLL